MRVVFVSDHFSTPTEPGILRTWQVAKHLADQGDDVVVIAPASHYLFAKGQAEPVAAAPVPERIRVVRMRTSPLRRGSALSRLRYYAEQCVLSAIQTWRAGRCDVVVAGLTPSMLGIGAFCAARLRRIPFVLDERDLALDAAEQAGLLPGKALWLARRVERVLHTRAAAVVTVTPGLRALLLQRGLAPERVVLAPNGYEGQLLEAPATDVAKLRARLGWLGRTVLLYAGGLGPMYDLDVVLDALARLDRDRFLFVIMGEGEQKAGYRERCEREKLPVTFADPVPKNEIEQVCRAADIGVVPLRDIPRSELVLSNKLFDYLGAGRPVIVTGPGDTADLVGEANAGFAVPAEDPVAFANALEKLAADPEAADRMGAVGREYVLASWSRAASVRDFRSALVRAARPGVEDTDRRRARVLAVVPAKCSFEHMAVNQRLRALAEIAEVDVVASYPESFPADLQQSCRIRGFELSRRLSPSAIRLLGFSAEVGLWAALQRVRRHYKVVYTFQDTSALAGAMLRGPGTRWVMDMLDDPALELRNAEQQGHRRKAAMLRLRSSLIGRMARSADLVVTIGCSDQDPLPAMIRQRYRVSADRLYPVRQAVRTTLFTSSEQRRKSASGTRSVFYVGWISALRGVHTLIEAIDILRSKDENVELRLAGTLKDGEVDIRAMIEARPYVKYLGTLQSLAVREEILGSDVCCCPFPAREELAPVQPVKVLEYLALGRPTVGSRTHGISSLIEHEISGLLATPECATSFAEAIGRIITDDQMAAHLSQGARARASAFDIGDVNKDLQERLSPWLS
jgi:colanic acid biosynthesis glycosyl transferase WcaI